MEYDVYRDENDNVWIAGAVDFDGIGDMFNVIFHGLNGEERAREYVEFANSHPDSEAQKTFRPPRRSACERTSDSTQDTLRCTTVHHEHRE